MDITPFVCTCGHPMADHDTYGEHPCVQCGCSEYKSLSQSTPSVAYLAGLEAAIIIIESYLKAYPEDIFLAPTAGQHGNTVDACSAHALRIVLPNIIRDIRGLSE